MNKIKFQLNQDGVRALMQSNEKLAVLNKKGKVLLERCGDGYEQDQYVGRNRANVMVKATSKKAIQDNHKNNTLLKAVRQ